MKYLALVLAFFSGAFSLLTAVNTQTRIEDWRPLVFISFVLFLGAVICIQ